MFYQDKNDISNVTSFLWKVTVKKEERFEVLAKTFGVGKLCSIAFRWLKLPKYALLYTSINVIQFINKHRGLTEEKNMSITLEDKW